MVIGAYFVRQGALLLRHFSRPCHRKVNRTADDKAGPPPYNGHRMFRRALTILVILSIAAFGYQPSRAMMMPADQAATASMAGPMAMPDCPGAMAEHDCCDQTDQQKQNCAWDAACAARCHVNIGIEPVIYAPLVALNEAATVTMGEPQSLVPERPGPLFRPPIL